MPVSCMKDYESCFIYLVKISLVIMIIACGDLSNVFYTFLSGLYSTIINFFHIFDGIC
jgi:hypothetical protein